MEKLFRPAFHRDLISNPDNPAVVAARKNDLFDWSPKSSTALCGGAQDPTVDFTINAKAAHSHFRGRNVEVDLIDVDPVIQQRSPVDLGAYHGRTVPPLCMLALRAKLFDPHK